MKVGVMFVFVASVFASGSCMTQFSSDSSITIIDYTNGERE
jgi:hypothetical protein